jgi:hypothetical protein
MIIERIVFFCITNYYMNIKCSLLEIRVEFKNILDFAIKYETMYDAVILKVVWGSTVMCINRFQIVL